MLLAFCNLVVLQIGGAPDALHLDEPEEKKQKSGHMINHHQVIFECFKKCVLFHRVGEIAVASVVGYYFRTGQRIPEQAQGP